MSSTDARLRSKAYVALSLGGPITLETVTYWPIAPNELVIETAAASVCATDAKAAVGKVRVSPPIILGHECSGTVVQTGVDSARQFDVGDKVVLSYSSCGKCQQCAVGANPYCDERISLNFTGQPGDGIATVEKDGVTYQVKGHFFGQSSMGKRIVARATSAVKLPRDTTEEEMRMFASLGCGIQTGAGTILNLAKPEVNSNILIFGAGSVGLAACLAAALTSPAALVVVDNSAAKLAMLPECVKTAATNFVDSSGLSDEDLVQRLKELTPDGRGYNYALDCVGRGDLVKIGHLALRTRGTVITVGGGNDVALQVTISEHLGRGITYKGTHQGDSVPSVFIPHLIDLWRRGKFPFDRLLTYYEFDELDKAFEDVRSGKTIKPVLINRAASLVSKSEQRDELGVR
ncbi:geraniol dehydrogenase [Echria macrotheca]|uniref:Geraniol dehydrogenase n=1 Tax=Echria macrotheca TaxID=438768 RepID=A0AAJ0FEE4_9PEZI|nr:geraniol dehydrogenase [Echria macrotheca]